MSYMTGLALGVSAGHKIYSLWNKREGCVAEDGFRLAHALPGRFRYRNVRIQEEPEFAAFIKHYLPLMRRIVSCEVNELSGSVIICFVPGEEAYVNTALQLLENLYESKVPYGKVGMKVRRTVRRFNRFVRAETGEMLDIKTLFAAFMMFEGLRKCLVQGQAFGGPNLIWWSYSLMKGSGR